MTATLVAAGVAALHGNRSLFGDLDLVIAPGDVIGLVGVNGAGKSTLLQILAGLRVPDAGTVTLTPAAATIGYLPQERSARLGENVADLVARRTGVTSAHAEMESAAGALAAGARGAEDTYAAALEKWLALGGADLDDRMPAAAADVGLDVPMDRPVAELSGGQSARAGLLSLLASRYDIVLLDEPTNDLDLAGLDRLERFVADLRTGAVVVSHDREFLARTVTEVVELDIAQQRVRHTAGGYAAYLAERETERRHEREAYDAYAERRQQLSARARRQRTWVDKGVAAARRSAGTDPDKITRKFRLEATEQQAAKARQTERLIERMEEVVEPRKEWQLRLQIAMAPRSGSVVAVARQAVVRRGAFVLGPVSAQVDWADRVVITGANGSGKSTLLALLLGRIAPDAGAATLGPGVVVGEIDQARSLLAGDDVLTDAMGRSLPELSDGQVRTLLAKFGLAAEHVRRPAASLSPGERTRAALALLQGRGVNLLVLDEPTNHLDLPAIEQLESAIESFDGTVLLVTHDRQMLATVRATRRWRVADGQVAEI